MTSPNASVDSPSFRRAVVCEFTQYEQPLVAETARAMISRILGSSCAARPVASGCISVLSVPHTSSNWTGFVASVRHNIHMVEAAKLGADIATIPYKVMQQFCQHPLTDKGLKSFLEDWNKSQRK